MLDAKLQQAIAEECLCVVKKLADPGAFVAGVVLNHLVPSWLRQRHINIPAALLEAPGQLFEIFNEVRDNKLSRCRSTVGPGTRDSRCSYCYDTIHDGEATIEHSRCLNRWHSECIHHWLEHIHIREAACPICRDSMDERATTAYIYGRSYRPRRMQLLSERCLKSVMVLTLIHALIITMSIKMEVVPSTAAELVMQTLNNILVIYAQMAIFLQINNYMIQRPSPEASDPRDGDRKWSLFYTLTIVQQHIAGILLRTILYGSKDCRFDSQPGRLMIFDLFTWAYEAMKSTGAVV